MERAPSRIPLVAILGAALLAWSAPAVAAVPSPLVTGPIPVRATLGDPSHDYPQYVADIDYASREYVEEEYFFEGTATRYATAPLATGSVISTGHPYKSRLIVRRPLRANAFNGTVVVEWVNVTSGYNNDALWKASADHLMRGGFAYVGVSAQQVGIHGPSGLLAWSPVRYAGLDVQAGGTITDDSLSYDIFSQAGQAVRHPVGADILGGLRAERVIAAGVSQSQGRLVSYYNSIHPLAQVFDAFYLYLGIGGRLRTDLDTKVFKINTENDVLRLGEAAARQPNSDRLHTWEVAGTSHVGFTGFPNRQAITRRDGLPVPNASVCDRPALSRVPTHQVLNAAYDHLVRWMVDGTPPPTAEPIELESVAPAVARRDAFGNALGGIRLAEHAVPIATNDGVNSGSGFCFLYGSHIPFSAETLSTLYPRHADYVSAVREATKASVKDGFILPADADRTREQAERSIVGYGYACGTICRAAQELRVLTEGFLIEGGDKLVRDVDEATLAIARGDGASDERGKGDAYAKAHKLLRKYVDDLDRLADGGRARPSVFAALMEAVMALIAAVEAASAG